MTDIPSVAALRDKVVEFENAGYRLIFELQEAAELYSRFGPPKANDFPAYADRKREMDDKVRAQYAAAGKECPGLPTSPWCDFLEDFQEVFSRFHALDKDLLEVSDSLDYVIDSPDVPLTQRMIPTLMGLIRQAKSCVHPSNFGADGIGFFRLSTGPNPEKFASYLEQIVAWRRLLEVAKQPPPLRRANGWPGVDLKRIGGIKDSVFIRMCEKAKVSRAKPGKGVNHRFTRADVIRLITVGRQSKNWRWNEAADSWAQELDLE